MGIRAQIWLVLKNVHILIPPHTEWVMACMFTVIMSFSSLLIQASYVQVE